MQERSDTSDAAYIGPREIVTISPEGEPEWIAY